MARLFLTLYIGLLASVFSFFLSADYLSSEYMLDVEQMDAQQKIQGYVDLLDEIHTLAGPERARAAMERAAKTNNQILTVVTESELLTLAELQALPPSRVEIESLEDDREEASYFRLATGAEVYRIEPDMNSQMWKTALLLTQGYLWGFFIVNGVCICIWVYLLQRKLKMLEHSALQIAEGEFSARAPTKGRYCIGSLNKSFNRMAERIEQLMASHKRLTNAVAHELRTPVFRLRCQLALLEHGQPKMEHQGFVDGMEEDLTELDNMVDELLSYARLERAGLPMQCEVRELNGWLSAQKQRLAANCQHPLVLKLAGEGRCKFDSHLLLRALTNLVRNADRYTNQQVEIHLIVAAQWLQICVEDDGPGIPEADRQRVLEPFERLDTARDRQSGGHGLGLSIVKEIVQQHGGQVEIGDSPLGGARIVLSLPR